MTILGIDLGTTNSLVAVLIDGQPSVLANEDGESLIPSAVAIASDGAVIVGRAAHDRLVQAPLEGRQFFKRDMGTQAIYSFGGRRWTPTECSALILQELKRIGELHLAKTVTQAVITVPAYFREAQRQATVDAARVAGLSVARILNEPTAAALAHGHGKKSHEARLMVFDLGGGTFDVSLLELFEGIVEIVATGGESHLGGEDYTDALLAQILMTLGIASDHPDRGRMRQQVEVAKRRLSFQEETGLVLCGHEMVITRQMLEVAGARLTARIVPVIQGCFRGSKVTPASLDGVILAGGASRMPLVESLLVGRLGLPLIGDTNPDRAIALGAAVQAALCERDVAVKDLILTDVCAHSLGISIVRELTPGRHVEGYFEPLIHRNSTVPISRSKEFFTLHPAQDEIVIEIYQGEARMAVDNHLLGKLWVRNLRSRAGANECSGVEVRFTQDMSGLLEVEAIVSRTGRRFSMIIQQRPGSMSESQIQNAIARLAPLKVHPRDQICNRAKLERASRLYQDLVGLDRQLLSDLLDAFEGALALQEEELWMRIGEQLDAFMARYYLEEGEQPSDRSPWTGD